MRDGDKAVHHGKGVLQAIGHVNNDLAPAVIAQNFDVTNQTAIDEFMIKLDGTPNKSKWVLMQFWEYPLLCAKLEQHTRE